MKIRKSSRDLILLLCTTLLITACPKDVDTPPGNEEPNGLITYGSADLVIEHRIPLGIGKVLVEVTIPLKFPVKQGDRNVEAGEFAEDWEVEGLWDLAAAGDVVGVSTIVYVPTTYEIRGIFQNCEFKFDIVEIMQFSQVKMAEMLAFGEIAVDMGEDRDFTYLDEVLSSKKPVTVIKDPGVLGTIYLEISNVSLPADTGMVCGFPSPGD